MLIDPMNPAAPQGMNPDNPNQAQSVPPPETMLTFGLLNDYTFQFLSSTLTIYKQAGDNQSLLLPWLIAERNGGNVPVPQSSYVEIRDGYDTLIATVPDVRFGSADSAALTQIVQASWLLPDDLAVRAYAAQLYVAFDEGGGGPLRKVASGRQAFRILVV